MNGVNETKHNELLTAGEFATLARTTKRTIMWYGAKGILPPYLVNESGHRLYRPQQIVDFQIIMLMRGQGLSLADISGYLAGGRSLQKLFEDNQDSLERQITNMQSTLTATKRYFSNLSSTDTLVSPIIKDVRGFNIYYMPKKGPYAKISDYHAELRDAFACLPPNSVFLTAVQDADYSPRSANLWIGLIQTEGTVPKPGSMVLQKAIPPYKAVSYVHPGSGALLSLITQQLDDYCIKTGLVPDLGSPFSSIELYDSSTPPDLVRDDSLRTELQLPLTMT